MTLTVPPDQTTGASGPRHYALVTAGHAHATGSLEAQQAFEKLLLMLLTEGVWAHGSHPSDSGGLTPGDQVLFCLATSRGPEVIGTAVVVAPSRPITVDKLAEARVYLGAAMPPEPDALTHVVGLEQFDIWDSPYEPSGEDDPAVYELGRSLGGVYRTGAVREVSAELYARVTGQPVPEPVAPPIPEVVPTVAPPPAEPTLSPVGPAMTLLLENWEAVDFGERLELLNGAATGERTVTPEGPIDALCEAPESGDMVAMLWTDGEDIEALPETLAKRLSWLQEYKARPGQHVRGMLLTLNGGLDGVTLSGTDAEVRKLRLVAAPDGQAPPPVPEEPPPEQPEEPEFDPEMAFAMKCMSAVRPGRSR